MDDWLHTLPSPATDPDIQEALSRRYGNDIIMLLPLRSGKIAVFNCARELTAIIEDADANCAHLHTWEHARLSVRQPAPPSPKTIDLEELGLL